MPSFSKERRECLRNPFPGEHSDYERWGGEGVAEGLPSPLKDLCKCVSGWHRDNSHVTEHDPEVQPSDSQYGELNTAAASERKSSNCLQSNRFLFT